MLSKSLVLPTEMITKDGKEDLEFKYKLKKGDIELTPYRSINAYLVNLYLASSKDLSKVRSNLQKLIEG